MPTTLTLTLIAAALIATNTYTRHNQLGALMTNIQTAIDSITAQLAKAATEITTAIAELEAREPSVDLSALKTAAQTLDDIVPDAPEVPAETPTEIVGEPTEDE